MVRNLLVISLTGSYGEVYHADWNGTVSEILYPQIDACDILLGINHIVHNSAMHLNRSCSSNF
jgi:hypothetical protein